MKPPSRAEEIFHEALECDGAERADFVEQACGEDVALRREVETLLAADDAAGTFLETPVLERNAAGASTEVAQAGELLGRAGSSVGPYELQRVLGVGGMGTVYLAQRSDGEYRKQVAVKLISRGRESDELLERFHNERQVLATLDHPGIARLLDGGTTDEGFPYLVMEYVDGEPIDVYCDEHDLTLRQRLELFLQVCDSVAYAHRHLVIHRDLKPSNILVNADGRVVLLDFGISKISEPRDAGAHVTRTPVATPLYASPETISGEPVTTSSDIYSLGVTLYKLLTGTTPYPVVTGSMGEMLNLLQRATPIAPSAAPDLDSHMQRNLEGDLDRVVLMALRKEAERRYATVEMFAEDIQRFLGDLPVRAQVDSLRYRTRKFVQRNRPVVIAVAALGALLIASSVVSFGLYRRAEKARAESVRAREQAETNAATANKVTSFLTGLFDHADPAETRGAELTARNLVDLGARRVREDLGGEPAVQSRVMQTIGEVYNSLGLPESAEALLVDAVDTAKKAHGDVHPEVASALRAYGDHLTDLSRFAEAQVVYNEALAILEELYGHDSIRLAPLINRIAESSPDLSPDEKIRMLQRSRGIVESQRSAEDPLVAYYLVNLARAYREKGEYDNALPLLQRAIAIRDAALEPDDPAIAQSLGAMAALLTAMQRYEEAIPHAERSLRILSKVYGPTSIQVTPSMNTLGKIRFELGQYAEARDLFERCRVINRETFGPENMRVGFDHLGLGDVHLAMQETGIARSHYERALEIFRVCYGETHVTTAYAHAGLGRAAAAQGMHDKAIEEYEVAVRLRQANLTPDHPLLRQTLGDLALSLDALGRHAEAREVRARSRGADLRRP